MGGCVQHCTPRRGNAEGTEKAIRPSADYTKTVTYGGERPIEAFRAGGEVLGGGVIGGRERKGEVIMTSSLPRPLPLEARGGADILSYSYTQN